MSSTEQKSVTAADLRPIDLFDDLDDTHLAEWAAVARWQIVGPGDVLFDVGETPQGMLCLIEGTLQTFVLNGDRLEPVGQQVAPTWIGAIPILTERPIAARMAAVTAARIAVIPAEEFRRLALATPTVHARVMHQVAPLMSRIATIEQNRERLAALGTMAAGLAHELNNPAAAARSSAIKLAEAIALMRKTLREFAEAGITPENAGRIYDMREEAIRQGTERGPLSGLDAADAEDHMAERLEELGISDAWQLAEPLAAAGVDGDWLDRLHDLSGPGTAAALRSVAAALEAQQLVDELREATDRMQKLVSAVKTYAYMDRGEVVEADVHEGLETTLTVMAHKLKHKDLEIVRDYDRDVPPLTMFGSEVNQVWTNLLANAIEAMGDSGTITVRTRRDGDCVRVDIADTGPGIPPDDQTHVFEPFFTTKEVGQGTGLGLDTARRIVVDRHAGSLTFDTSEQGTTFHVWLPLHPATAVTRPTEEPF